MSHTSGLPPPVLQAMFGGGLVVARLLSVPLGIAGHLQYVSADGLYGLAWVVVGAYVAATRPRSVGRTG